MLAARFSFPYVTVRTSIFRIIIEITLMLFLWLILERKIKLANLKKNYFFWIFLGLIAIEFIVAIFGESFWSSIFSDLERMWGIFTVLHLFLFYFLARSFFQKREWEIFFNVSFVVSLLVSLYGIVQRFPDTFNIYVFEAGIRRITSTMGNPTYVAIYLLFNIAFALYFYLQNRDRSIKYFYLSVIIIDFLAFSLTDIRGAYLGLIFGLVIAVIFYIWLGKNKKYKISLASLIVLIILLGVFSFLNTDNRIVQKTPILNRLSSISFSEITAQTRIMSWRAAWEGIKDDPFLGVGMENFNVPFNKYLPASYFSLAPTETYFDRAHNQFINMAVESGILALMLYLCLPILIFYYLLKGYRLEKVGLNFVLIFSAITTAYFIHLFFVFDDINSLLFFIILSAFVEFNFYKDNIAREAGPDQKISSAKKISIYVLLIILVFFIYSFNVKVLLAARHSAFAYMSTVAEDKIDFYQKSIDLNIIPMENLVVNYSDYLVELSDQLDKLKTDKDFWNKYLGAINTAEEIFRNEIKKKPNDAFLYMKLAQLNIVEFLIYEEKKYVDEAILNLEKGIDLSPERLQLYYLLGEGYIISGQADRAVEVLEKALNLNPKFKASYYYLGRAYLDNNELDKAYDYIINKAVKEMQYEVLNNNLLIPLSQKLAEAGQYDRVIDVYDAILKYNPNMAQIQAAQAAAYIQIDEFDKAIEAAQKAAEIDPSFEAETNLLIDLINSGDIESLKKMTQ